MHNNIWRKSTLAFIIFWPLALAAQTSIHIDASVKYQTIQGFGASDAWNAEYVGKYWSPAVKNDIAKKLFSKTVDVVGNPMGIGLSRWRFNIGAGSAEQGDATISGTERRVECFLNEDGTYNWNKQSGQQWFLDQAKTYGVEQLVAFVNSPPRFYTKNGRANSSNTDVYGSTNLKDGYYDDFALFMANILKHFEDAGTHFSQISPVNEPQFVWNSGQEGCPWKNLEIKQLTNELNSALVNKGLSTKILLAEAASFTDMHMNSGNADKSDQIWKFFTSSRPEYIGGNSQMLKGLGGHSYWTDGDDATIKNTREALYNESLTMGGIELYQTEYCLLSKDYNDYLANSLFLGKMIYADLAIANVSIWDYWTTMERERYSQKNRFYLIRLKPTDGDYADLNNGGSISADKNLWVLGNFSLFIRPGYKRIKTTGASDLAGLMGSAFMAPDSSKMVVVYVNWGSSAVTITHTFDNLPAGLKIDKITPYITDTTSNLRIKPSITDGSSYIISPRSVTTMVVDLIKKPDALNETVKNEIDFNIYPNPNKGLFEIKTGNSGFGKSSITIMDLAGRVIFTDRLQNENSSQSIDITDKPSGVYYMKIGGRVKKIVKQ
jgi:O-glycosyl hydrolase